MGGAAPAAETSDGTALAPKAAAQQDAGAWRATADRLRNTIASAQAGIAQLDAVDEQWRSLVLGTDGYEREAAHDLAEHQRQRAALEQQLTQSQGELAQLEEQARKSGVEPGALR